MDLLSPGWASLLWLFPQLLPHLSISWKFDIETSSDNAWHSRPRLPIIWGRQDLCNRLAQVIFSKHAHQTKRAPAAVCPDAWVPSGKKHAVFTPVLWPINWKTSWPSETRQSLGFQPGKARKKRLKRWRAEMVRIALLQWWPASLVNVKVFDYKLMKRNDASRTFEHHPMETCHLIRAFQLYGKPVNLFSSNAWLDMKIRVRRSCSKRCAVQVGHCSFPPLANEHQA